MISVNRAELEKAIQGAVERVGRSGRCTITFPSEVVGPVTDAVEALLKRKAELQVAEEAEVDSLVDNARRAGHPLT